MLRIFDCWDRIGFAPQLQNNNEIQALPSMLSLKRDAKYFWEMIYYQNMFQNL